MISEQLEQHINKAKKGNQIAFKYLLDNYWSQVYKFQLKRTQNEYIAEEITVQTFSKAFVKLDTFDVNYSFITWLIAISKNIHIDLIRKKSIETTYVDRKAEVNFIDENPTAEDQLITEQNLSHLLQLIKRLKPHYQEVIQLRYFQELTYKEISEKIEEPITNVKVKLLRAKKLLAEIIKDKNS
ncbi:RNA polymerase sigma factor [Mesonia aestuariivivens]|uniref:Sigma-70 family RNA polymerase sigma factor n=1 Tax=Mesonia aestuariivivens TaxID=2796128 RepID=A0ABS6W540_9FLAO|nr:sigma-70 family RNA polymerase sigma factor [Mesonia aestuariivivens]MBW2962982.1 sigma-70 family RNA polymerase sigma factor [Mesonia aestuariivivens]